MALKKIPVINDEIDLKLFSHIAKKNIIFVIIFLAIAAVGAFLYLRYTYPLYETQAVIQLDVKSEADKYLTEVTGKGKPTEEGMAKRVELLRSPVFLQRSFAKLPLDVSYYTKGTILNSEMYRNAPFEVTATVKNQAIYGTPVYIRFNNQNEYTIRYSIDNNEQKNTFPAGKIISFSEADMLVKVTNWARIQSDQETINSNIYFFILNNPDNILPSYMGNLRINILSEEAKTLQIIYSDRNPVKASDIVNTIVEEFRVYDLEKKAEGANNILNYIDEQLLLIYNELYESEMRLDSFRKVNNIDTNYINDPIDLKIQVQEFEKQLIVFEKEDFTLANLEDELQKNKDINVYKLAAIVAGSEFQGVTSNMLNGIQDLMLKKEQYLYDVTPVNAQIEAINYQINIRKKLLLESIKSIRTNYAQRKVEISRKLEGVNGRIYGNGLGYNPIEFNKLQRLYSVNENYYNELVQKRAEYSITKAGLVSENVVLERSRIPQTPISPQKRIVYIACLLVGLFLGMALIIIRYLLYDIIINLGDIKKYTDITGIGLVPKYKKAIPVSQIIVDREPRSLIAEALRSIRTNLQFINNDPGSKIIAITSTISGEGKTFFALNLAGVIAFSYKKVIIIDLDLRKPKIHIGFGTHNKRGMSTILAGKDNIEDCIQKSTLPNLDFITAGVVPPNPSELIIGPRMEETLRILKSMYDYVIIDNPPIGVVTDGMKCLQMADYPIYVFKSGYSKRFFIESLERLVRESHINQISYILNGVELGNIGYGKNRYSRSNQRYGYGYGYGYGYYDEERELGEKKSFIRRLIGLFRFKRKKNGDSWK
jgi:tyrosine-protein kinase Etk/Wzc